MKKDILTKYEIYAKSVIKEKGIEEDSISLAEIAKALIDSCERTYHAVALDIDGTIKGKGDDIPKDILSTIAEIVKSGAYVLFVTGSGESTVKKTLNQIKNALPSHQKLYRKIHAIDGNGCRLFYINESGKINTIPIKKPLKDTINDENYGQLLKDIYSKLGGHFDIQEKECSIRLVSIQSTNEEELRKIVTSWHKNSEFKYIHLGINVVSSKWHDKPTFDISNTDKDYALTWFYTKFDFIDVPILRIGDQGKEDGNDYTFLDSPCGFSVGSLSRNPIKCFPIFNLDDEEIYCGVRGTYYLLNHLKWSSRLTIPSTLVREFSKEYYQICDKLRIDAKDNNMKIVRLWSKQAKSFFPNEIIKICNDTGFNNLFDQKSGAIRLTDSEWTSLNATGSQPLMDFFTETNSLIDKEIYPGLIRSLYTDTGIILRGPRYYLGLSEKPSINQANIAVKDHCKMLNLIMKLDLPQYALDSATKALNFTSWKICLALLDNFRNSSLLLYNMLFQAASLNTNSRPYWKRLLKRLERHVAASIDIYYSMLMINVPKYQIAINELRESMAGFYDLKYNIDLLYNFLESNGVENDKIIRKWREVDHPGQIISALNSIKHEISNLIEEKKLICALGLMYGGLELPFAFKSYYDKNNEHIKIAEVMGISFYGQEKGSTIMRQYSRDILESAIPTVERIEDIVAPGDVAIVFDDNIMTGRSIELARDRLLTYGSVVPFCVCVRFPPENRIFQMKMRRHGGIDPYALGNDIKGLVAQSPYSRIFTSTSGYKDVTGIFDLSRQRIEKYLIKNGLANKED